MTYQPNPVPNPVADGPVLTQETVCPECGKPGAHWVVETESTRGFWTCEKFYDESGRRINPGSIIKGPLEILGGLLNAKASS